MVCSSSITSLSPTRYAELRARVLSLQRSYLSIKARHSYHQTLHGLLSKLDVRGVQETIPSRDSAVQNGSERRLKHVRQILWRSGRLYWPLRKKVSLSGTKMADSRLLTNSFMIPPDTPSDAKRFKSSDTIGTPSMTRITGDQLQTIRDIVGAVVPRPTSMSYPQTASTSVSVYDPKYMLEALSIAQEAYDNGEVPVGCVFVHHGEIIARGRNRPNETLNGTRHAEIEGIDQILASGKHVADDFQRCDLYVTVEPCVMCASALRQIRIRKVYFGCANERFGGNGSVLGINDTSPALTTTTSSPYASEGGFYREEAIILLRKFYIRENENAPVPKKKTNRVLKTDITPVAESVSPGGGTIDQA
ncbi:cytidine deaminase-like protein [Jimgerdemannia flammicorona]|uniref:tRNA(adenine(34)) deaminase n=1 Tax=Jimgerdemannia flammicorona TaxID=994334 RepID=A0A433QB09_9FUNG|nr:cytidine deaminase-like protein [Jimgerdemannia flammicorona]